MTTELNSQTADLASLLRQIGAGDRTAFSRFYGLTAPRVCALAEHLISNPEKSREIVKDAYLLVWNEAEDYRPSSGSPLAWLTKLVHRLAVNHLRSCGLERSIPHHTELLPMVYLGGLTYREIADRLGVPVGAVKLRIREALDRLGTGNSGPAPG
ncbi:sigma factor [Arthrobacter sp. H5]|uniref:sigma factor n=1 Tax=Arthrobacter sp. H5 TaxID=1267973 RepID=UPI0004868420|nr:sigma factor [Arthrobacter sp. H5]